MKTIVFFVILLQSGTVTEPEKSIWVLLIGAILAIWEVVGRLIPSTQSITLIGKLVEWLHKISDYLSVKK
jgi:hypothetical protein